MERSIADVESHHQVERDSSAEERRAAIEERLTLLRRFVDEDTVFLEIGAGDACMTREVARTAKRSYALDVSKEILGGIHDPRVTAVLSDGRSVPVPNGSVSLVYSCQVMEHIDPDDALDQLHNIHRAMAPGGAYLCVTPNRMNGPHDVPESFDREPSGSHLKEYTWRELARMFREVGFRWTEAYVNIRHRWFNVPMWSVLAIEGFFSLMPYPLRHRVGRLRGIHELLFISILAVK